MLAGTTKACSTVPSARVVPLKLKLDDGPVTRADAWISPWADRPQCRAVSTAVPPGRAEVTVTEACGAKPATTVIDVAGLVSMAPVQTRLA